MTDTQITIGDVAAAAGVSVATVSKVINDRYGVAETTSARVRAVIDELGYTSSLVAQSLREQALERDRDPRLRHRAVQRGAAEGRGPRNSRNRLRPRRLLRLRPARGPGRLGAALARAGERADRRRDSRDAERAIEVSSSAPIVAVDHNVRSATLPTIDSDNLSGAVTATEHLIDLGHRRIGFLAGPARSRVRPAARARIPAARSRQRASRSTPSLVRVGGYLPETARDAARELLLREPRPTAIFAANDASAIETIAVARSLGLDVPGDLSVIGFDNVPESALCEPPLTTIEQPIQRMGEEAVRMLLGLIDDPSSQPAQVVLPTRLVERGSCRALVAGA